MRIEGASAAFFVDPEGGDLHLAKGSAAIDAGIALTEPGPAAWDIDGQPRDASPDVGADER